MSPAAKNGLMLVVVLAVLGGAGLLYSTRSSKEHTYPTTGSETQWICSKCQKHYPLSPAQWKDWMDSKDRVRRDPNFPGKLVVFWCDDCKEFSVVRARVDRKTLEWFASTDPAGNPIGDQKADTPKKPAARGPVKAPGK
jgi:hypothetical protein